MHLDECTRQRAYAIRQIGGDITDQQRPDSGVQRGLHEEPHEAHADDDAGEGKGQETQALQDAGRAGLHLDDDIGNEQRERHAQGGAEYAEEQAVLQRQQRDRVLQHLDPVLPAHEREGACARHHRVGHQRGIEQHRHRQHYQNEQQHPHYGEQRQLRTLQLDHGRPVAAAGDGHELLALGGQRAIHDDERDGGHQHAHPQGRGRTIVRRETGGDHLVDMGGEYVHPARHAQHRRGGERGESAHQAEHEGRQDGRAQHRQGHPQQGAPGVGTEHARGLFQRHVELGHGRGDDEIGNRHVEQSLDQDHAPQGVDVERRLLQAEHLHQREVEHAIGGIEQQRPAYREQQVRDHHRQDGDDPEQELERYVGARVEVGEQQGEARGQGGRTHYEYASVEQNLDDRRVAVGG